jgi:hypothetical protein
LVLQIVVWNLQWINPHFTVFWGQNYVKPWIVVSSQRKLRKWPLKVFTLLPADAFQLCSRRWASRSSLTVVPNWRAQLDPSTFTPWCTSAGDGRVWEWWKLQNVWKDIYDKFIWLYIWKVMEIEFLGSKILLVGGIGWIWMVSDGFHRGSLIFVVPLGGISFRCYSLAPPKIWSFDLWTLSETVHKFHV